MTGRSVDSENLICACECRFVRAPGHSPGSGGRTDHWPEPCDASTPDTAIARPTTLVLANDAPFVRQRACGRAIDGLVMSVSGTWWTACGLARSSCRAWAWLAPAAVVAAIAVAGLRTLR